MNNTITNSADFTKVVRIGTAQTYGGRSYSIFCKINFIGGKLSITGVEGPTRSGNALGSCGQISDSLTSSNITACAPGWNFGKVAKFRKVWERWHLNYTKAGTPEQNAALTDFFSARAIGQQGYDEQCKFLAERNLLEVPDPRPGKEGETYKYGTAWLRVEVPAEVVKFLRSLPDTDRTPAWV